MEGLKLGFVLLDSVLWSELVLQVVFVHEHIESPQPADLTDGLKSSSPNQHGARLVEDGRVLETVCDRRSCVVPARRPPPRHARVVRWQQLEPLRVIRPAHEQVLKNERNRLAGDVAILLKAAERCDRTVVVPNQ